jgi:hypothetical protein
MCGIDLMMMMIIISTLFRFVIDIYCYDDGEVQQPHCINQRIVEKIGMEMAWTPDDPGRPRTTPEIKGTVARTMKEEVEVRRKTLYLCFCRKMSPFTDFTENQDKSKSLIVSDIILLRTKF